MWDYFNAAANPDPSGTSHAPDIGWMQCEALGRTPVRVSPRGNSGPVQRAGQFKQAIAIPDAELEGCEQVI